MSELHSFKTTSKHISQLGQELVTDQITALTELVKNAYDADASEVLIELDTRNDQIVIIDNGHGMGKDSFVNNWLVIGTSNKIRKSHTPKGRKHAGRKGIGRFAVESLSKFTRITSFSNEGAFSSEIDWLRYDEVNFYDFKAMINVIIQQNSITSIEPLVEQLEILERKEYVDLIVKSSLKGHISYLKDLVYKNNQDGILDYLRNHENQLLKIVENYSGKEEDLRSIFNPVVVNQELLKQDFTFMNSKLEKKREYGTIIRLQGLRNKWTPKDIKKLKREMTLLISPSYYENDDFDIVLNAKTDRKDEFIKLDNEILNLNHGTMCFEFFQKDKTVHGYYEEKGCERFDIQIKIDELTACGDFKFDTKFFLRDTESLKDFNYGVNAARNILNEYCGVKLYRDGLRVRPYGDTGNDWLFLDSEKITDTHSFKIGNNQLIGKVDITSEKNSLLIDATNREGIIENEAYDNLVAIIKRYISEISKLRANLIIKKNQPSDTEVLNAVKANVESNILELRNKVDSDLKQFENKTQNLLMKTEKKLSRKTVEKIAQETVNLRSELNKNVLENYEKQNEIITTLSKQIVTKNTELDLFKNISTVGILSSSFVHETRDSFARLETSSQLISDMVKNNSVDISKITSLLSIVNSDINKINHYTQFIDSFLLAEKRNKAGKINYKTVIEEVINKYEKVLGDSLIKTTMNLEDFYSINNMFRIDFESILINLITNSMHAMRNTKHPEIVIDLKNEGLTHLRFEDNGSGIDSSNLSRVFDLLFTTKKDGTGLGLTIVKDIVNKYAGRILVSNSPKSGGAVFEIMFDEVKIND